MKINIKISTTKCLFVNRELKTISYECKIIIYVFLSAFFKHGIR